MKHKSLKIMDTKKITDERWIEVFATNNEGEAIIAKRAVGEKGVNETYMDIYKKLMDMEKDKKWEIKLFRVRNVKSAHHNESKKRGA